MLAHRLTFVGPSMGLASLTFNVSRPPLVLALILIAILAWIVSTYCVIYLNVQEGARGPSDLISNSGSGRCWACSALPGESVRLRRPGAALAP